MWNRACFQVGNSLDSSMAELPLALSFDDILLQPGLSELLPSDADVGTHLTAGIPLNIPVVSAAINVVPDPMKGSNTA